MGLPLFHLFIFAGTFHGILGDSEILLERNHTDASWIWLTRYVLSAGGGWTHESSTGEYTACDVMETKRNNTDSWLVSEFIPVKDARAVTVKVTFTMRKCNTKDFKFCKEHFKLYSFETDKPRPGGMKRYEIRGGNLSLVGFMNSSYTWSRGHISKTNDVNVTFSVSKQGMYLGFQDTGACIAIKSVQVFYYYCPRIEYIGVSLNRTVAPPDGRVAKVRGKCYKNSENGFQESLQFVECLSTGRWSGLWNIGCLCKPGYFRTSSGCQAQPRFNVIYLSSKLVLLSWTSHEIAGEIELGRAQYRVHCNTCEGDNERCTSTCNATIWSTTQGIGSGRGATVSGLQPSTTYLFSLYMLPLPVAIATVHVLTPKEKESSGDENKSGNNRNATTSSKYAASAIVSLSSLVALAVTGVLFFVSVVMLALAYHLKRRYSSMTANLATTETTSHSYENRSAQSLVMDELCVHTNSAIRDSVCETSIAPE